MVTVAGWFVAVALWAANLPTREFWAMVAEAAHAALHQDAIVSPSRAGSLAGQSLADGTAAMTASLDAFDEPAAQAVLDRLLADTVAAVHRPHNDSGGRDLIDLARPTLGDLLKQLEAAPNVLIMDLRFPDLRVGLALIRRVRELDSTVPVIVLSGWPQDLYGQPEEAMVARILVKPIPPAELIAAVAAVAPATN